MYLYIQVGKGMCITASTAENLLIFISSFDLDTATNFLIFTPI